MQADSSMVTCRSLISDHYYHHRIVSLVRLLHQFMESIDIEHLDETITDRLDLTEEEYKNDGLMLRLWLLKQMKAPVPELRICLNTPRTEVKNYRMYDLRKESYTREYPGNHNDRSSAPEPYTRSQHTTHPSDMQALAQPSSFQTLS